MQDLAYGAARASAPAIRFRLAQHREHGEDRDELVASLPDEASIGAVIDAAFWASLRREEGFSPKISLAFLEPGETSHPLLLDRPLPLDPATLTRVAPAVERPGIHLGVSRAGGTLIVWGVARAVPKYCCVVEVAEPGLLVVKHRAGDELAKFANVAVLRGDRVTLVDGRASKLPDCPALLTSLLGLESPEAWAGATNVLVQLSVSMRAHGRGGLILVVPEGSTRWRESLVHPLLYAVAPPFRELGALTVHTDEARAGLWREELARAVDAVAGLTAVDGATVLTSGYDLLAFGAKVVRRKGSPQVESVMVTEPVEGGTAEVLAATQIGGTRHLAAAQFVHDQRDAIALVASQDGRFTIFVWSPVESLVHAHRVEALLL